MALIQASKALDQVEVANDEEKFGVDILRKALEEPMRALCSNAGYNGDVEVAKALEPSRAMAWIAKPASTAT